MYETIILTKAAALPCPVLQDLQISACWRSPRMKLGGFTDDWGMTTHPGSRREVGSSCVVLSGLHRRLVSPSSRLIRSWRITSHSLVESKAVCDELRVAECRVVAHDVSLKLGLLLLHLLQLRLKPHTVQHVAWGEAAGQTQGGVGVEPGEKGGGRKAGRQTGMLWDQGEGE